MIALILLLILAAARPLVVAIGDPDFFWHLRTGGWIWQHKALPQEFLFTLTAPEIMNDNQRVTMSSYWVVQVLYHILYSFGGLTAIALLRVALMVLLIGTLILRSPGRDTLVFLGSTLLGIISMRIFPFERPQIFSFVFFSLLLLVLDRLKDSSPEAAPPRYTILALPLLMVAWANSHGAFIIGQAVLFLYLVMEGLKFAHPRLGPISGNRYRYLLGAGTAGICAGFINPNTYHVFLAARLPAWSTAANIEYQSTLQFFRTFDAGVIMVFWFLLAVTLLFLGLSGKKLDVTRLALVAGTGAISLGAVRFLPFFILSAVPLIEDSLPGGARGKAGRVVLLAGAITASLLMLPGDLERLKRSHGFNAVNPVAFPVDAADFLLARGARGNLYNAWAWGGYLMWRLSPTKVFSDGRNSSWDVFWMNSSVETGDQFIQAGEPPWKTVFRKYRISYAVLPLFNPQLGKVMPLLFALGTNPDWSAVFIGENSVVFAEKTPDNQWAPPLPFASNQEFFAELIRRCEEVSRRDPSNPLAHIARGDLLSWLRRQDDARAAYQDARRLLPRNQYVLKRLAALEAAKRR